MLQTLLPIYSVQNSTAAQAPMARWSYPWSSLSCFTEGRERCKGRMEAVTPQLRARWLTWLLSLAAHLPRDGNFLYPSSVTSFHQEEVKELRSCCPYISINTMPQKQQLREREGGQAEGINQIQALNLLGLFSQDNCKLILKRTFLTSHLSPHFQTLSQLSTFPKNNLYLKTKILLVG